MADDDIEHPIMPTGSGVADLKVAREEDALESGEPQDDLPATAVEDHDLPGVTASGAE